MALTQISSNGIKDDSIVNADIKSDAAIALSKLASTPAVLTGSTNNTITTVTAANTIQGEASLTFDGSTLKLLNASVPQIRINNDTSDGSGTRLSIGKATASTNFFNTAASGDSCISAPSNLLLGVGASEKLRILSDGKVGINESSPAALLHITHAGTSTGTGTNICASLRSGASGRDQCIQFADGATSAYVGMVGGDIYIADSGSSEKLRIQSDGHVKINDGDLVIGTAGHGIDFSAQTPTQAGGTSTGGETLNHYEEGSWTPSPKFNGGNTGMSVAVNGHYVRIGKFVTLTWSLRFTAKGSSTGGFVIDGVPFTCETPGSYYHHTGAAVGFNTPHTEQGIFPFMNTTYISFRSGKESTGNVDWSDGKIDDDTKMMGTVSYRVA